MWRVTSDEELSEMLVIISIHTLRVEGDVLRKLGEIEKYYISIHTLRVEGDF